MSRWIRQCTRAMVAGCLVSACAQVAGFDSFNRGEGPANGGGSNGGASDGDRGGMSGGSSSSSNGGVAGNSSGGRNSDGGSNSGGANSGGGSSSSAGSSNAGSGNGGVSSQGGSSSGGQGGDAMREDAGAAGSGDTGAGMGGGAVELPISCRQPGYGRDDCGPDHDESCCSTRDVAGGSYARGNDSGWNATLSGFRYDRFEVTVGRFRQFMQATAEGYVPADGSGKHQLEGGRTLDQDGWNAADWNGSLPNTLSAWVDVNHLRCSYSYWKDLPDSDDNRPVSCVAWYEAYAFCIWDGGYLPTYEEWDYAVVGGNQQRNAPWGDEPLDPTRAVYGMGSDFQVPAVGSTSPLGDGRFGQADLVGGVWEWVLTSQSNVQSPCVDCAGTLAAGLHVGGSFADGADRSARGQTFTVPISDHWFDLGFRCARPRASQ